MEFIELGAVLYEIQHIMEIDGRILSANALSRQAGVSTRTLKK